MSTEGFPDIETISAKEAAEIVHAGYYQFLCSCKAGIQLFPVVFSGNHVVIPKEAFLDYVTGKTMQEELQKRIQEKMNFWNEQEDPL